MEVFDYFVGKQEILKYRHLQQWHSLIIQFYPTNSSNSFISKLRSLNCLLTSFIGYPFFYHVNTGGRNPPASQGNLTFCFSLTVQEDGGFVMKCGNSKIKTELIIVRAFFLQFGDWICDQYGIFLHFRDWICYHYGNQFAILGLNFLL